MLKTLTVWNFALLEHVEINFSEGMNILTGETGAGKSILIDALGAVLGHRLTGDAIRTGCDWLRVEAIFDIEGEMALHDVLQEQAIEDESNDLIITRQITKKGKNAILVNGCHVTLSVLKSIGEFLVDIHGQHENLALLKTENQFALLDNFNDEINPAKKEYQKIYEEASELSKKLKKLKEKSSDSSERLDMLHWQEQEIENAHLEVGEDETLEAEIKKLSNAERITENLGRAYDLMDGNDEVPGALDAVSEIKQRLEVISKYDDALESTIPMLEDALCQLKEASYNIRDYQDGMDFDAERLDELQNRMDTIDRLCRKYGPTIEKVLEHYNQITTELDEIENYDEDISKLTKALSEAQKKANDAADKLTTLRKKASKELADAITEQVVALGMPDAKMEFSINEAPMTSNGKDALTILFTANAGEAEKPLAKIASGGELSRIALAIKTVEAMSNDASSVGSMVFDEIDTGIGGKTAQMVAERIALVAQYRQVLCITHLPQIASMADAHFYIAKTTENGKTTTAIEKLEKDDRIREIARMASGADATKASLLNASEMIENADAKKKALKAKNKRGKKHV